MSLSLSHIRTTILAFLREEDSESSSYSTSFLNNRINTAQYRICAGIVVDAQQSAIKKLKLPFLFKDKFYKNIQSVGLTTDAIENGDTLIVSDTTHYPTAGHLWINNNIITYTGTTPTTFTGCTDIGFPHPAWTRVYPIFELPTDYMNTLTVMYNNGLALDFVDEQEVYQQINQYKGWQQQYAGYNGLQNNTTMPRRRVFYTIFKGKYFAPFFLDNSTGMFNLSYEKLPTDMVADVDTCIIPNDTLALDSIANLAVADILFDRWEEERSIRRLQYWIGRLRELYVFFNRQGSEDQFGKSIRAEKWTGFNF